VGEIRAAYLVRGDDPSLVGQAAQDLLAELVGERDASTVVEEHGGGGEDIDVGAVVDALTTPPFITDLRAVVVRDAGRLLSADAQRVAACLDDPLPGVALVLVSGGGTVPAALVKATQKAGSVLDATVGTGRARSQWLGEQLRGAPVRLDARAASTLGEHLGEDLARVRGLLDSLAAAYGQGASVDEDMLTPFLGEAGGVAPWELTDAVDRGDTSGALLALDRMLGAGGTHPLVVMSRLHRHFEAMLRLDGAGVSTPEQAAELLGMRSAFPAKKVLEQGRALGTGRIGRAVTLLAEADLDLRGRTALEDRTVLEVLVARLSRLGAVRDAGSPRRRERATAGRRR
jgi:DNA polymerase-3 subunit delta